MIRGLRWQRSSAPDGVVPGRVQGNILRPYGFPLATHVFAGVSSADGARAALRELVPNVTTGEPWTTKPSSALNIAFTYGGLVALGVPRIVLDSLPAAFVQGMAARSASLGDTGASDPTTWDAGLGTGAAHILFTVHATGRAHLASALERVHACLAANGLTIVSEQTAEQLPERHEHFGYADGVGQPAVAGVGGPAFGEGDVGMFGQWHGLPIGELFHGHIDADGCTSPGPAAPFDRDGTFLVWRKLYEDVATFRTWVAEQAALLEMDELLLRAKLVGRWPDASPLALTPDRPDPAMGLDPERVNAFDYSDDPDGLRCPLGAHIRRTNPRRGLASDDSLTARQRIVRRGMPYGPPLPDGAPDDHADRGIFFVAYMADIERQFEFIQTNWCNDGDAVHVGHDPDPFIGHPNGDHKFTIPGEVPKFVHPLVDLVTTRGGEYLWAPSMDGLRRLATADWVADSPKPRETSTAGTIVGTALAPLAATIGFVRGKRAVHMNGAAFEATVVVSDGAPRLLDGTVLARAGTYRAVARLSRGFGLPFRYPDVHGIAVRLYDAGGPGIPQDLLVATARRKSSGRDATAVTRRYEQVFSSMLRLRSPSGELVVRAWPVQPMPDDATVHAYVAGGWEFELGAGAPGSEVLPVARLILGSPLSRRATEALEFNLSNDGGGLEAIGLLNTARPIVYRASQAGRSARRRLSRGSAS
ncbi:MAG TPA: Dyp-type peroxidase [Acidimicrobiales bacterium]|nr:Dyp-type peroxidase [Acidimicrobiales bacterium]